MKGTKLWQAAGSPIIQGRSRRQRPSWQQWLPAWAISAVAAIALVYLAPSVAGGSRWSILGGVFGALVGAFSGVEVTRAMGWRFPLLWGVIVGVVVATLLFALLAALLPS